MNSLEDFDCLKYDETRDHGVRGGNRWNDVSSHGFNFELGLHGNVETLHADICAGRHEIQTGIIVFVPGQIISFRKRFVPGWRE